MEGPLTYRTNLLEWEKGRQLKKLTKSDGKTITYTYNANGIRTSKTVGTSKHTYILDGTKILSESYGAITTYVQYDSEGSVCGINYNGTPYYFLKNQQGDVIAITDKDGGVVARYRYDAWGVCTIVSDTTQCDIATINPFRYRGYYYDRETGLYYLQSRYYDPETGRFVNSDEVEILGFSVILERFPHANLFSYCSNAPTGDSDLSGCMSANQLASLFSTVIIFDMFLHMLYMNYARGLVKVGLYTTKVVTPVATKAFWWKPLLIAAIVAAAVMIIVGVIAIMYSNRKKEIGDAKKKIPGKLMKDGKVDLSKFNTRLPNGQGFKGPDNWKIVKDTVGHATKVWKLYKNMKRIASLLKDGTIYGK